MGRTMMTSLLLLSLLILHSAEGRNLKDIKVECCEEGFKFDSSFLTIDIQEGDVKIESALGDAHFTDEGTVIDSPLLKVNTHERVRVQVADGEVLNMTTLEDGTLDLTIGKEGAVASLKIDPEGRGEGTVGDEIITVDFSDENGAISVDVGEKGKIVDFDTDGEGNAEVKVGKDGKVAKLNVSGKEFDLQLSEESEDMSNDEVVDEDGEDDGNKEEAKSDSKDTTAGGESVDSDDEAVGSDGDEGTEVETGSEDGEAVDSDGESETKTEGKSVAVVRLMGTEIKEAFVEEES